MSDGSGAEIALLTPIDLASHTRAWLLAAALAEWGYRVAVIEGGASADLPETLPFTVRSIRHASPPGTGSMARPAVRPSARPRLPAWLRPPWRIARSTVKGVNSLRRWRRIAPWVERARLLVLMGFHPYPAVARRIAHGVPLLYDAGDFYSARYGYREVLLEPVYRRMERACLRAAHAVVTVSDGLAGLYREAFGVEPILVRNSQDRRLLAEGGDTVRQAAGLPPGHRLIVAVCRPVLGRDVESAIRALDHLPDSVHLAFVGAGFESYRESTRNSSTARRLHFMRPVRSDRVVPFIRSADLFLMTNYPATGNDLHTIATGFFQAVAAGLPLVYPASLPEVARLAGEWDLGVPYASHRPRAIAEAVAELLQEPRNRESRRNAARAEEALDWRREVQPLRAVVARALAASSPAGRKGAG